ncbi:substrate-binding domain-containing protein [Radiobacillus kanasensis]|uniref:substrate-binding domain-containing protein n=1 Tax=Radiobacillus kanasensis TaxID=2844358 RepID=UPI001E650773|nr:substrate-binding domain-containing protein [Radiobacillus kanasensis]UFT98867.1 substrate-binding domain-containing protein [Radiobacillus kanasensis]
MKRLLFLLLAIVLVFGLIGCSNSSSGSSGDGDDKVVLGLAMPSADHGWLGALIQNAEDQAKALVEDGTIDDYVFTTAADPTTQANNVDDLLTQEVDAIVMLPIESEALSPVGTKIKEAGIPLVIVDRELTNDTATVLVKGDNKGIGANAGKYFVEHLGGSGKIVEITGSPSSVTTLRSEGFYESIEGSDIEIISTQSGDFQTEASLKVMENILQANPEIDAVYTHDDEMALGVIQAINEANRTDIQFVTGAGGHKEAYEIIQDGGLLKATFLYSPLMVKDGVKVGAKLANGEEPEEEEVVLEATQITEENVADHYNPDANY